MEIMSLFLEDYSREELRAFADAAYSLEKFDDPAVAPVRSLDAATHSLELWHGPTSAFKDMALQMLPHLLYASLKKPVRKKPPAFWWRPPATPGRRRWKVSGMWITLKSWCFIPKTACLKFRNCRW